MRRPLGVHKQRRSCNYCHVKVRLAVGALCAVTVLAVSGIAIATPTAGTQLSSGAPSTPPTADLDGDKVFDDLAAELKGADAGDVVSVIVRLTDKLTRSLEPTQSSSRLGLFCTTHGSRSSMASPRR